MPGTVIRQYRESRKLSQKYVSAQMGISQNAYSKIENNITQLTVNHVKQLSEILKVPITDLLKDEYEIHRPLYLHGKPIQKEDVLRMLEHIQQKLQGRHAARHDSYLVCMSLLGTVDNLVSHIY